MTACPECQSKMVRRSRSAQRLDLFHQLGGKKPYRCRDCRARFFSPDAADQPASGTGKQHTGEKGGRSSARRRLRRRIVVTLVFFSALVIFLMFLRYLASEHSTPDIASLRQPAKRLA